MAVLEALAALPQDGLTVAALKGLDTLVPGVWANLTRPEDLAREVLGKEAPPKLVAALLERARAREAADPRYGRALQLYQLVDQGDQVSAGASALGQAAGLLGGLGSLLGGNACKLASGLSQLTPKPDTTQAVDAGLKLAAEVAAFGILEGLPSTDKGGLARFVGALEDYARYDRMRIAAWVVFDGIVPLGPDFVQKILQQVTAAGQSWAGSALLGRMGGLVPGGNDSERQAFIGKAADATGDWIGRFVKEQGLTQAKALGSLGGALGLADRGLDAVAAALDATTTPFAHTGTQTVARRLLEHTCADLRDEAWKRYVDGLR